ncbi:MAG: hypothetical protein JSV21_07985 [Nitrospirota bacterium]|nr:MAG: hypothetical protein JSV21_07985 [Nitrospirota bacterium]
MDLCSLDYLIGTLATAYKGMVTSLVAKDFCISSSGKTTSFKGTVISLPEDGYIMTLMQGGREIGRTRLNKGYFELYTDVSIDDMSGNVQLDLIRSGRHIGTFLLKREAAGGQYASAFEISEELRDYNFRAMNDALKDKKGLQEKGENIITSVMSSKKDWKLLSDSINTFARDLFWTDIDIFKRWYIFIVRYSALSAVYADRSFRSKAISNFLSLIELPAEHEIKEELLGFMADQWASVLSLTRIDVSPKLKGFLKVLGSINKKLPDHDIGPALASVRDSVRTAIEETSFIGKQATDTLMATVNEKEFASLMLFTHINADRVLKDIKKLPEDTATGIQELSKIDPLMFDQGEKIRMLLVPLREHISYMSSDKISILLEEVSRISITTTPDVYKSALTLLLNIIEGLADKGDFERITILLEFLGATDDVIKDDIMFDQRLVETILKSNNDSLLSLYSSILTQIFVPPPSITGYSGQTWAEIADPMHFKRIKGFMMVTCVSPDKMKAVLYHLIANLFISGVFIPDDRLFQRDITQYLNTVTITDDFLDHYLLLQKFPVYFHEVGASGRIRELSTEIDSWGNDPVIYFLRKQVHVNASSLNIELIEKIISSWALNDKSILLGSLPDEIYDSVDTDLLNSYSQALKQVLTENGVLSDGGLQIKNIFNISDDAIKRSVIDIEAPGEVKEKIMLLFKIYKGLVGKYSHVSVKDERGEDRSSSLAGYINKLRQLKAIFISPQRTEAKESFYFKRHIAFGIPSVIGSYSEPKFDSFGEFLKTEDLTRVLLEEMISEIDGLGDRATTDNIISWLDSLGTYHELFELHGMSNPVVNELIDILTGNILYLSQIVDLLRSWQRELTWMVEMLYRRFHDPLINVLIRYPADKLPASLSKIEGDGEQFINRAADTIMRDILNGITGFEELDRLLNSLVRCIGRKIDTGDDIQISSGGNISHSKDVIYFDELSHKEVSRLSPVLGSKAKNLILLFNKGLSVPFGVVFSASKTTEYESYVNSERFSSSVEDALLRLEQATGKKYGDGTNPLLLSVRSGSYISMPGILSSILYCGMNISTVMAMSSDPDMEWHAWDSYRRFIEHYSNVVNGLPMADFEEIANRVTSGSGISGIRELDRSRMKELVLMYKEMLLLRDLSVPEDPFEQLKVAISAIYRSWFDERALQFRNAMGVSEHWGTSVTLLPMVRANNKYGGASVFFTRDPSTLSSSIYGETRRMATGDDIVFGKLSSRPLSTFQVADEGESLEQSDPVLYDLHKKAAELVEKAMGGIPQEVEAAYTIDSSGTIHLDILQTKRMEFRRGKTEIFHDICRMESSIIGRGIGVHGGALSGVAIFSDSADEIKEIRAKFDQPLILLRTETNTDDVSLMPEIDGLLTSTGGATSHAAILAQKFDLTSVVGCSDMVIQRTAKGVSALIGDLEISEGTSLSIDGASGIVYSGVCLLTVQKYKF